MSTALLWHGELDERQLDEALDGSPRGSHRHLQEALDQDADAR